MAVLSELIMNRSNTRLAAALMAAAALAGCDGSGVEPDLRPITLPRALSQTEVALVDAGERFGFDLLGELAAADPGSNLMISPLSASMALGMTMNGAAGGTLDGMRAALGFGALPLDEINASYASLIALLAGLDDRVTFELANAIFHREGFGVEAPFLEATKTHFDAAVEALDFASPAAAVRINDWVAENTNGRITEMVEPPIDPLTMMFLLNAIYFKGTWTWEFDPEATATGDFRREGGGTTSTPFMEQEVTVPYTETATLSAVDLPYGGQAYAMTLVLPRGDRDLADLVAELDAPTWAGLVADLRENEGTVRMPRFRMEYDGGLNDPLVALGMGDAFSPALADFTPMYRHAREAQLHIKKVKQKTFVQVDEEGTEAAAVTSVEVGVTCACGGFFFDASRPFLFAIRERLTGTLLFVGLLYDPPQD